MDNPQAANSEETPARRYTIDANPDATIPRYDFVLPSYSRDRRKSSVTSTLPPGTIVNDGSTNVNISVPDLNSSTLAAATARAGITDELFLIDQEFSLSTC